MIKAYRNFSQVITLKSAHEKDGRNLSPEDLTIISNASVIFDENEIIWVGSDKEFPNEIKLDEEKNYRGKVLTPELVDSHTHIVFGGDRAKEYTMRLNGADYQEIANAGGGILNTMKGTNEASLDELFLTAKQRIERINSYGVGTIEIKSGYGLNYQREYEISHLIDRLKKHFFPKVQIKNTYMAAHAIPKDFKSSSHYLDEVVIPLLKKLSSENIIDAVDIFHEKGYFTSDDTEKLFQEATSLNIKVKSHADEFNDNKGAILACKYDALSTDHLLATTDDGIKALANSKTVATLLPGTGFFLGKPQANGRKLLDSGVKVAIASDYNPGSCHCDNVLLIASLAAPQYKMNICELWSSITLNAAHALDLKNQGAIIKGLSPRFSIFNTNDLDRITYNWGLNLSI